MVTSPIRSLLPSHVDDRINEVPLYMTQYRHLLLFNPYLCSSHHISVANISCRTHQVALFVFVIHSPISSTTVVRNETFTFSHENSILQSTNTNNSDAEKCHKTCSHRPTHKTCKTFDVNDAAAVRGYLIYSVDGTYLHAFEML